MYFSIFVANFNHYGLIQKTTTIGKKYREKFTEEKYCAVWQRNLNKNTGLKFGTKSTKVRSFWTLKFFGGSVLRRYIY